PKAAFSHRGLPSAISPQNRVELVNFINQQCRLHAFDFAPRLERAAGDIDDRLKRLSGLLDYYERFACRPLSGSPRNDSRLIWFVKTEKHDRVLPSTCPAFLSTLTADASSCCDRGSSGCGGAEA